MNMRIRVRAHGHLARYLQEDAAELVLPPGSRVGDVLATLDISWGEVGVIAVNGRLGDEEMVLNDGDELEMLVPLGGGSG